MPNPWDLVALPFLLVACGSNSVDTVPAKGSDTTGIVRPRLDTSGACSGICDAATPTAPIVSDTDGWGDVTTYGGVENANPSKGGACNYGATGITRFAAIQVNSLPNDLRGQWNGGRVCGQCVQVQARTAVGWKSTIVRIVDKCPDGYCGIDLGGLPATDLMGAQAGRYSGHWRFVACPAFLDGLSDGPPSLHVKEGSNAWWSLVQVRNPVAAVATIQARGTGGLSDSVWSFAWATEAENFFKVPVSVLNDTGKLVLEIGYQDGTRSNTSIRGSDLARADTSLVL
jgi:expansin (peptidoglycan-binding protein)